MVIPSATPTPSPPSPSPSGSASASPDPSPSPSGLSPGAGSLGASPSPSPSPEAVSASTTANCHYFYHLSGKETQTPSAPATGGFWRDTHASIHGPTAVLNYQTEITENRHMLIGGKDGYVRNYNDLAQTDDAVVITSYVCLPTVRLGDDYQDGMLMELIATVAARSGDVDYEILVADSHEEVADATAHTSGTWTGTGRQTTVRPRARGGSMIVKLSNGENLAWGWEQLLAVVRPFGRQRLL